MTRSPASHRIALLFNANKVYDREIITGIGTYLSSTRVVWDLFLEDDLRASVSSIEHWQGDGVIADFDDPEVAAALSKGPLPVVAVGSSYEDESEYPVGIPYIATDNSRLIKVAYEHLIEMGLTRFALYSMPISSRNRWAQEREKAFVRQLGRDSVFAELFRGQATSGSDWSTTLKSLTEWLQTLPKPVGIIAVNDARARHVLQACLLAGIAVPEEVAIVGIDNDPLTRTLSRIPVSSVIQGTEEMGRTAAQLLHRMLHNACPPDTRVLVAPVGVNALSSSKHEPLANPYVMRARHYIRQYAGQGIKTEQVADYVGISRSTLEGYFRRELNCTVHDAILRFKLEMAQTLLLSSDLSSTRIAVQCGFTSLQYMYAVFKRELGCTPREYQDQSVSAQKHKV